jgi:hypothetical protein
MRADVIDVGLEAPRGLTSILRRVGIKVSSVNGVVQGCGEWVFGRQPIVRNERVGPRAASDVPDEMPENLGRPPVEPTAMRVENHRAGPSLGGLASPASYSTHRIMAERDAIGRDDDLTHDGVERNSSGDAAQLAFVGLDHGSHLVHDDPILGRYRVIGRPRIAGGYG